MDQGQMKMVEAISMDFINSNHEGSLNILNLFDGFYY
jgi:hypothetical protein